MAGLCTKFLNFIFQKMFRSSYKSLLKVSLTVLTQSQSMTDAEMDASTIAKMRVKWHFKVIQGQDFCGCWKTDLV